ncbi:alpha/beta superfamily hydrolase [Agromyces albus]|nr:alpha/beta superfamily hydrolase [Agromyces albus]
MSDNEAPVEIRAGVELPAIREEIELQTSDGLTLVGELATPAQRAPVATLVTLHPLPTAGGFMDSHILRKAAARLPALADLAVLRFNTRGTSSPRGTSDGEFGHGIEERADVAAAMSFVEQRHLPHPWLLGWSFGTELVLKYGLEHRIDGAILLSPPLHRTSEAELHKWNDALTAARRAHPRARRLPATSRGGSAIRGTPQDPAYRRGRGPAPLGGRGADTPRTRRDRRDGESCRGAAADDVAGHDRVTPVA